MQLLFTEELHSPLHGEKIVSPLTADHRRWQIEVVTVKVLPHGGMIMIRGKNCQVRLLDLYVLILPEDGLSSGREPGGQ
jgi:hypothetical protein